MFDHVADVVEGIDGENNKEPWKDRHVWCLLQAVLRILQQTAPTKPSAAECLIRGSSTLIRS